MSDKYYTYNIRVANPSVVEIERWDPAGKLLDRDKGRFGYIDSLRNEIDDLVVKAKEDALRDSASVKALGEALFRAMFDKSLMRQLVSLYNLAVHEEDKLLQIVLEIDEETLPEVAALPWEFMCVPEDAKLGVLWLATAPDLIFIRRRKQPFASKPIILGNNKKLRIALAIAAPSDLGPVVYDKVENSLIELVKEAPDKFELLPIIKGANVKDLRSLLSEDPHIFHFIGHGQLLEKDDGSKGQIAMVDVFGKAEWEDAVFFSDLLNTHRPNIVVLQACEGGQLSSADAFVGVASRIIQQNIPVVVAMQYEVTNQTAISFSLEFYQQLADMNPVDRAVQNGRYSVALDTRYKRRDFATPVLFMGVEDGHLFQRDEDDQTNNNGDNINMNNDANKQDPPIPPAPETLSLPQVAALGRQINKNFNKGELEELCFELGKTYDDLPGSAKGVKSRELVDYCRRNGKVESLWNLLYSNEEKKGIDWSQAIS